MNRNERRRSATRAFFDDMAQSYDKDLDAVGWSPVALVQAWPFYVQPSESYLDVGCGTGALLSFFAGAQRKLHGMDLSPEMVRQTRRRVDLRQADVAAGAADDIWPFADNSFDKVTSLAMLEFVEELDVALDELVRVLKPGGRALITVEDTTDWLGESKPAYELRYGEFPLWRRSFDVVEASLPPGARIVRHERARGYEVLELGFITGYLVIEIEKDFA